MAQAMLLAYRIDGHGGGGVLDCDAVNQAVRDQQLVWIHLDAQHPATELWLQQQSNYLDHFVIEALLASETRPRMMQVKHGALLILRGVNLNTDATPEDMVSIRLWVDPYRIISLRRRKLKAIIDIEAKLVAGEGPTHAGNFISMLAAQLSERMQPILTELDESTDDIEEQILEQGDSSLRQSITNIRKKAIMFRRYMAPQRDAMDQLRMANLNWLQEADKRHLQETYNHITRYVEDLDAIRERAQIVKDELANMLTDRLNKNMYILSVIAAIFLPLGFLTGLLGINVGGIPGAEQAHAFWIFSGILLLVVVIQIILFKRFKWF